MLDTDNVSFQIHNPMEFLYSMFAVGTNTHFYGMIYDFDLNPNDKITKIIDEIQNKLSKFMTQEIEYFFDLHGLGYILYKYILMYPEIKDISSFLEIFNKVDSMNLVFNIVRSVCKNNMPAENSEEYIYLKHNTDAMLKLVMKSNFQDEVRRERVIEALQNPEEVKQRFYLLLSQYYTRCYSPIESQVTNLISLEKAKYEELFNKSPKGFLEKYFNLTSMPNNQLVVHLSFFKYISWHHYSLYCGNSSDWFILGIYSDLLFSGSLSSEKLANFFKSMSDPNRIEILKFLSERPWFGQELAEKLNITPATVSYHMGFLQKLGVVTFIRADNRSYYSINNEKLLKPVEEFINYFKK